MKILTDKILADTTFPMPLCLTHSIAKLSIANNTVNRKMWSMRKVVYEKNLDLCKNKCTTYWHINLSRGPYTYSPSMFE